MGSSQEQHCSTHTSQVTSKKSLHMQDLWAPQKTAVHLASPSKADGTALARRLVLGAPSPRTALPLLATHGWGRATSHSLGGSIKRWRLAHAGKDAAALCFFPTLVFFTPAPAYYTLHRCHGHASAPTDFMLQEAKQQPWLRVSFTLRWAGQPCCFQALGPSSPTNAGGKGQCISKRARAAPLFRAS